MPALLQSYLVGLWFSLRTHASQIWQNAQPAHEAPGRPITSHQADNRASLYKRVVPSAHHQGPPPVVQRPKLSRPPSSVGTPRGPSVSGHPRLQSETHAPTDGTKHLNIPPGMTAEQFSRAVEVVAAQSRLRSTSSAPPPLTRAISHVREASAPTKDKEADDDEAGGHDAPNWSRTKSASVLMGCTILYAVIAGE
jgi:Ca2+:H+ antiporter